MKCYLTKTHLQTCTAHFCDLQKAGNSLFGSEIPKSRDGWKQKSRQQYRSTCGCDHPRARSLAYKPHSNAKYPASLLT